MNLLKKLKLLAAFFICPGISAQWSMIPLETKASFRSMNMVGDKVIWAGGTGNTVIRSIDAGKSWEIFRIPDTTKLDFRGIEPIDKKTAVAVSAGTAQEGQAKIYRTQNGGKTWTKVFESKEKDVFLDGILMVDAKIGFVYGDPLAGQTYVLATSNGGKSWQRLNPDRFPQNLASEASFAASNSGMVYIEGRIYYAFQSRMFYSDDLGASWQLIETGFPSSASQGIFGIHFLSKNHGFLLGGDYQNDLGDFVNFSQTKDGGKIWQEQTIPRAGLKESAAHIGQKMIAVGTSGTSISLDGGDNWQEFDKLPFHVVRCGQSSCFAIGAKGNLATLKMN